MNVKKTKISDWLPGVKFWKSKSSLWESLTQTSTNATTERMDEQTKSPTPRLLLMLPLNGWMNKVSDSQTSTNATTERMDEQSLRLPDFH